MKFHPPILNRPAVGSPTPGSNRPAARSLLGGLLLLTIGAGPLPAAADLDPTAIAVKASSWEQKAHGGAGDFPPEATLDGSLAPKSTWRAEGDGQWIEYDLGRTHTLAAIRIAFFKGDSRRYRFEVQVSDRAEADEWRTVLPARESSGGNAGLETHTFPPVTARHVRVIGHGNSDPKFAKWINLAEVAFVPAD